MEPHKAELKTSVQHKKQNNRFQIVKLEERIAPQCSLHYNPHGKEVGHDNGACR